MTEAPEEGKRRRGKRGPKPTERISNPAVIDALQATHGLVLQAAKRLGVHRKVLTRWIAEDPQLQAAQTESKEALADLAESAFIQRALSKSDPASAHFLPLLLRNLGRNAPPPPKTDATPTVKILIAPYRKRDEGE